MTRAGGECDDDDDDGERGGNSHIDNECKCIHFQTLM